MQHRVELIRSEEGYAVLCPDLPGCASQGGTEEKALANIKNAITDYLEVVEDRKRHREIRFVEVAASWVGKLPGISHLQAFCQSGHVILSDGIATVLMPRANPINAYTKFPIVKSPGLTAEQFQALL